MLYGESGCLKKAHIHTKNNGVLEVVYDKVWDRVQRTIGNT